jgi:hypothetical protein
LELWVKLGGVVENGLDYSVSNKGRVWSSKSNRILNPSKGLGGYEFVKLSQNSKPKQYDVHRLVALAFIKNDDPFRVEVNHIDGNKTNNELSNLEWVTRSENVKHAYDTGLRKRLPSTNTQKASASTCKPVAKFNQSTGELIGVYQSAKEAIRHDSLTPRRTISYQCKNETYSTKNNYYHRFASEEQVRIAKQMGVYHENPELLREASE